MNQLSLKITNNHTLENYQEPSNSELDDLLMQYQLLLKENKKLNFKLERLEKDRSIAINLLQQTVADLASERDIVVSKNQLLEEKNVEIELKNTQLLGQQDELRIITNNLSKSLHALEISYNELEQISTMASHDLKTPLRSICGFAQLLERRYKNQLDEDAQEYINHITLGAKKINAVVSDFINYTQTKMESGTFETVDLNEIMSEVKQNLQHEIIATRAYFKIPQLPSVKSNRNIMVHLFQNIIENALKYSKQNLHPNIIINAKKVDDQWSFSISDNGLGLDEKYQHKVFEPFQRVDHLEKPGTGMGLAICKKIIQLHHGKIWYNSQLGVGTTFNFTIPA
jgi:signal transduction histidine kinase